MWKRSLVGDKGEDVLNTIPLQLTIQMRSLANLLRMWWYFGIVAFIGHYTDSLPKGKYCYLPRKTHYPLLLLMIDGFRWDYFDQMENTSAFNIIEENGVKVKYVEPLFPSTSFPSWLSIITGVYPESHGILDNYVYNKTTKMGYDLSNFQMAIESIFWYNIEPIWTTASREGLSVAMMNLSRCTVHETNGEVPEFCKQKNYLNTNVQSKAYRESLYSNIKQLENGSDFVVSYWDYIDTVGHFQGPDSEEMEIALDHLNKILMELLQNLTRAGLQKKRKRRLLEMGLSTEGKVFIVEHYFRSDGSGREGEPSLKKVNVIILSDHGLSSVGPESSVIDLDLSEVLDVNDIEKVVGFGGIAGIHAKSPEQAKKMHKALLDVEGLVVYPRDGVPYNFHFRGGDLTPDLLVVAEDGYHIAAFRPPLQIPSTDKYPPLKGNHGWMSSNSDMRAIFFGIGPNFKKGHSHPPIRIIDDYQIFPLLLGIKPMPNNGSCVRVEDMFVGLLRISSEVADNETESSEENDDDDEDKDDEDD